MPYETDGDQPDVPEISPELIRYLERVYPDRAPTIDTPDRGIWVQVGTIRVVEHLRDLYDQQFSE